MMCFHKSPLGLHYALFMTERYISEHFSQFSAEFIYVQKQVI